MREVNFSIPNANKASVGITTALYDRRALDCTSTLPLINSLNNLAYLTTSSGRIRDILTVDGGIERLVCILKEGRSKDMMEMWKWNLAFQCIVNIGVRGSEAVRTRVVEADMVPVIATILDNYFQVIEKCKERNEIESRRRCPFTSSSRSSAPRSSDASESRSSRSRRHAPPPPISIPDPRTPAEDEDTNELTPTVSAANLSLSSPPERTTFPRQQQRPGPQPHSHHHHRSSVTRADFSTPTPRGDRPGGDQLPLSALPPSAHGNTFAPHVVHPVRDIDRLPSMVPTLHPELSSQPQSPTTPGAPAVRSSNSQTTVASARRPWRRPSVRHQLLMLGSDDDAPADEDVSEGSATTEEQREPVVGIQSDIVMQDIIDDDDDDGLRETQRAAVTLNMPEMSSAEADTFNITHRSADGSTVVNPVGTPAQGQMLFPQTQMRPPINAGNTMPFPLQQANAWYGVRNLTLDRPAVAANILAAMPRDEDVLMSLQLLAYVSKYCNLRSYFQKSHLVPRLKIGGELRLLDSDYSPASHTGPTQAQLDEDWDNEYVRKPGEQPFNIFPLIEKFTAKPTSSRHGLTATPSPQQDNMQYWAGVVMRNLCRKDETRGGIRQCAYWQCGKWEEFTRQFAKCRRCRRTKYCSKECQKGAWGSHRFWCVAAEDSAHAAPSSTGTPATATAGSTTTTTQADVGGSDRHHRRHAHHHSHHHHHHHPHHHHHH